MLVYYEHSIIRKRLINMVYKVFANRPTYIADVSRQYSPSPREVINAYDNEKKAFTEMYKRYRQNMGPVETTESFQKKIDAIPMGTPKRQTFFLPSPSKDEVRGILRDEAKAALHGQNASISDESRYIQNRLDNVLRDRQNKWDEAQSLFNSLEQTRIKNEERLLEIEWQQKRQLLLDVMNGDPDVIEQGMAEVSATLDVPFDLDFQYSYDQRTGLVAAEVEIINGINIPFQKAVPLASGRASIKNKLVREIAEETKDTILSFVYYFASKIFEISLNISKVELSVWDEGKGKGYIWVRIPREGIMRDVPKYLVPAADIDNYRKVADIRIKTASVEIAPILAPKFMKLIEEEKKKPDFAIRSMSGASGQNPIVFITMDEAKSLLREIGYDSILKQCITDAELKGSRIVAVDPIYKKMIADKAIAAIYGQDYDDSSDDSSYASGEVKDRDPLFEEAARFVVMGNTASTSSLQRRYEIGYNRAGRLLDQMEHAGIVGPANGAKPRQVLLSPMDLDDLFK